MALTAQQLGQFHEQGYIHIPNFVDPQTTLRLQEQIEGLHEKMVQDKPDEVGVTWEALAPEKPRRIRQLMNSELVSPMLDEISRSSFLLDIIEQLIGSDIYLFHSKLLMKAAGDGSMTPWHQDYGYWHRHTLNPTQMNCQLAIDRADEENGALRFSPSSHKQGQVEHEFDPDAAGFNIGIKGDIDSFENDMIIMQPGDAVFFGPYVLHASAANSSTRDRRANTFAFDLPDNNLGKQLSERMWRRGRKADPAVRHEKTFASN